MSVIEGADALTMDASDTASEDDVLLQAVAEHRDHEAFCELYRRYERLAYNLACHLTGNADRAAEAVQEAMLRVWLRASTYQPERKARGWMLRIVARESLRKARRYAAANVEQETVLTSPASNRAEGTRSMEREEEIAALRSTLDRLPMVYRQVVALHYGAGLNQREIGEELNVSSKTVANRLNEALRRLRVLLAEAGMVSTASLLGANTILMAVLAGRAPPTLLAEAVRTRLSQSLEQVSRRFAAETGRRAWVWAAGLLLPLTLATAAYWIHAGKQSRTILRPALETREEPEIAKAQPGVLLHWTFEEGPPEDCELVNGSWEWQGPIAGQAGRMRVRDKVCVLPKLRLPDLPIRITVRFHGAKMKNTSHVRVFRTDGASIPPMNVWQKREIPVPTGKQMELQDYVLSDYQVGVFANQIAYVTQVPKEETLTGLGIAIVNMDLLEVEVRSLRPEDVPEHLTNKDALLKELGGPPTDFPRESFLRRIPAQ